MFPNGYLNSKPCTDPNPSGPAGPKPTWPAKNATAPAVVPTGAAPVPTKGPVTAGAGKAAALTGAGLAGVLGLAAFIL